MRIVSTLSILLLPLPALAQSVVESRTFIGEHFISTDNSYFLDLGLQGPTQTSHGIVERVYGSFQIVVDYEFLIRNQSTTTATFEYRPETALTPLFGDCVPYRYINSFGGSTDPTAPGALAVLADRRQVNAGIACLLYTSPSPRDRTRSRMPSSA